MNNDLKRQIILENYQNPYHKELVNNSKFLEINTRNGSCIDNLNFQILIEDDLIKEIYFTGEACAISTATSSIMIKLITGKTIKEAINLIENYNNMINENKYEKNLLGEAIVFDEIYKQENRKGCALLPWNGLLDLLLKELDN